MICWYRLEVQIDLKIAKIIEHSDLPTGTTLSSLPSSLPSTGHHSVRVGDGPASAKRDQPTTGLHPGRVSGC